MKRLWPFTLLVLPALALLGRVDPAPSRPRITALPPRPDVVETSETLAQAIERHFPTPPPEAPLNSSEATEIEYVEDNSGGQAVDPNSWKRYAISSSIVWFAHHQNDDGSFGDGPVTLEGHAIGRTGVTSLAILACLGHGYSPLSNDELDGKHLGAMVRDACKWLIADQREDGTFRSVQDNGFDQALATFALNEAYGMTVLAAFKQPTLTANEAMARMQQSDGSWGGPAPTAWALLGARSAMLNELPVAEGLPERALRYQETAPHPADLWNRLTFAKDRRGADATAAALASSPPAPNDFAGWYHATSSLHRFDGPEGSIWKAASETMKQTLLSQHAPEAAWIGTSVSDTIVRSSLAMLTLQLMYHSHGNVFGTAQ